MRIWDVGANGCVCACLCGGAHPGAGRGIARGFLGGWLGGGCIFNMCLPRQLLGARAGGRASGALGCCRDWGFYVLFVQRIKKAI